MATLELVVAQLKENNNLSMGVLKEVSSLNGSLSDLFGRQKQESYQAKETAREAGKGKTLNTRRTGRTGGTLLGARGGGLAGGLTGGLLGGLLAGGGVGLAAAGVGIAAFLGSMAGADFAIAKLGDGKNLKTLLENIAGGLAAFDNNSLKNLGILFGTSALFGTVTGMKGSLRGALGIGIIGAGIAAFFTEFALADVAISSLGSSGEALKKFAGNFADAIESFDGVKTEVAALLVGSALFGLVGARGAVGAGLGIATIGAGIAGFVTTLAGADVGLNKMQATGSTFKTFSENVSAGLKAFSDAGFAQLLVNGAIFGAIAGAAASGPIALKAGAGAILGLGVIGLGISAFLLAIAAGEKGIQLIGADGSGFKNLATGIANGLKQFADLPDDIGKKTGEIGVGIGKLFAANALGGLVNTVSGIGSLVKEGFANVVDFFFGTDLAKGQSKSPIQKLLEGLVPLKTLDRRVLENLDKLSDSLTRFTNVFQTLSGSGIGDFGKEIGRLMQGLGVVAQALPLMTNGGKETVKLPGGGTAKIDFGPEGDGGLANPNIDFNKIKNSINSVYDALGINRLESSRRDLSLSMSDNMFGPRQSMLPGNSFVDASQKTFAPQNLNLTNPLISVDISRGLANP